MADITVEFELSTGVWTDKSNDVYNKHVMRVRRGIFGSGPQDLVAGSGFATFVLRNRANSAGIPGLYSPGHPDALAGFAHGTRVRIRIDPGNAVTPRYIFMGRLKKIAPTPGTTREGETWCLAVDWMDEFLGYEDLELSLAKAVRSDECIQDLVDLVDTAPANVDLDTGLDTYPFVFDDLGGGGLQMGAIANDICMSERGFLYVRGNTTDGELVRFENRHARALAVNQATIVEGDLNPRTPIEVPSDLERIYNDIEVATFPRRIDADATTVLISQDAAIKVDPGETVTVYLDYRDPAQEAVYVGGDAMVTLASGTDWTANANEDGSGADLTASFTVVAEYFGSRAMIDITNNHATLTGYLRGPGTDVGMQARGKGLYRYAPVVTRSVNVSSVADFGHRELRVEMPYQNDRNIGQGVADFLSNLYSDVGNIPTRVRVKTEDPAVLQTVLSLDIGDKVTLSETMTGVVEVAVFINGIEYEIRKGKTVSIFWTLAPADTTNIFILDSAVGGILDTNRLGYG